MCHLVTDYFCILYDFYVNLRRKRYVSNHKTASCFLCRFDNLRVKNVSYSKEDLNGTFFA